MITDALKEDAQRMEDACCQVAQPTDIWQDRIIYWVCVAVLHIITWIIRKEEKRG